MLCVSQVHNGRDLLLTNPVSTGNSVLNALKIKVIASMYVSFRLNFRYTAPF